MSYFRFFPDCQFIAGPARGTIYFISKNKTYHLSKMQSDMAKELIGNNSVEEVVNKYGSEAKGVVDRFMKGGFGTFYEKPVFSEPYYPQSILQLRGLLEAPPKMRIAYLQLSDACDAKCGFCNNNAFYNWQGCNSCIRWPKGASKERLTLENLEKTINDLIDFNIPNVIFSGGDPLMDFDALVAISKKFKTASPNINLKVNTNGMYFNEKIARIAKNLDIIFIFSVFGTSETEYNLTTGVPELYTHLNRAILLCKKFALKYDVALVIPMALRDNYQKMREFAVSLGGKNMFSTELIPRCGKRKKIVSLPTGNRRVEDVNSQEFFQRQEYNYCMNGNIAIASNGSILPCPSWAEAIGNIHTQEGLRSVFKIRKIDDYWEMNKDKMLVCNKCENRYACVDCSILEWETRKDMSAQQYFCDYVPELGKWQGEKGVKV